MINSPKIKVTLTKSQIVGGVLYKAGENEVTDEVLAALKRRKAVAPDAVAPDVVAPDAVATPDAVAEPLSDATPAASVTPEVVTPEVTKLSKKPANTA